MRDPYDVLGLDRSASAADIKRAYRRLAKDWHPDRHGGDKRAQQRFAELNAAHEILGDKEKRAQFDRGEIDAEGKPRFQGFGRGGFEAAAGFDPRAFAEAFAGFGGRRGRASAGPRGRTRSFRFTGGPGGGFAAASDEDDEFLRTVFEAAGPRGGARAEREAPRGADVRAEVAVTLEDIASAKRPQVALPTGKVVALTLPSGVADGQVIRLKGQGRPSPAGGPAGDALVTVRLVPHPLFRVEGSDLRVEVPIGLEEAVLGARIAVPTLSGKVQLTVPPWSKGGGALRLKGKGLPKAGGAGDLLVALRIVLPEAPDPELEALARRWRGEGRPSPRGRAFE